MIRNLTADDKRTVEYTSAADYKKQTGNEAPWNPAFPRKYWSMPADGVLNGGELLVFNGIPKFSVVNGETVIFADAKEQIMLDGRILSAGQTDVNIPPDYNGSYPDGKAPRADYIPCPLNPPAAGTSYQRGIGGRVINVQIGPYEPPTGGTGGYTDADRELANQDRMLLQKMAAYLGVK